MACTPCWCHSLWIYTLLEDLYPGQFANIHALESRFIDNLILQITEVLLNDTKTLLNSPCVLWCSDIALWNKYSSLTVSVKPFNHTFRLGCKGCSQAEIKDMFKEGEWAVSGRVNDLSNARYVGSCQQFFGTEVLYHHLDTKGIDCCALAHREEGSTTISWEIIHNDDLERPSPGVWFGI